MSESDWLASSDPQAMLRYLQAMKSAVGVGESPYPVPDVSDRKLRLFACACWRHLWTKPDEQAEAAAVEEWVDGLRGRPSTREHWVNQESAAAAAIDAAASMKPNDATAGANILRDIVGNPFVERPTAIYCRTYALAADVDVQAVAAQAYCHRNEDGTLEHDRLGIVADAIEECMCVNPEILTHLRDKSAHFRGCWALDLILGKS